MIENVVPFLLVGVFFYLLSFIDTYQINITRLQKSGLIFFSLFILSVFAGCRWSAYEVGYDLDVFDYGTYKNIFNSDLSLLRFIFDYKYSDSFEIKSTEPGYVFYSTLIRHLIGNIFWLYLLITNSICVIFFYKSLQKNHIGYNPIFIILLFFVCRLYFQYNFILLRQSIAICIVWMWGFPFLQKRQNLKYLMIICISCLFHFSAIICVLGFFLDKKVNYSAIALITFFFFVLGITHITDSLFNGIVKSILNIIGISDGIGEKLIKYINDNGTYRSLNILNYLEAIPMFYASSISMRYIENPKVRFFNNMFWLYILLITITMNFGFLTRMMQYYIFSYFYLLVYLYQNLKQRKREIIFSCFNLYLLIYLVRYVFYWFYETNYSFALLKI